MADPKYIVRDWNREIEAQDRRLAAQAGAGRRWRVVVWLVLELAWLAGLVAMTVLLARLQW
jgi:hypothetical protein